VKPACSFYYFHSIFRVFCLVVHTFP
jgi:hypothetical protein